MHLKNLFHHQNQAQIKNGQQIIKVHVKNGYKPEVIQFQQGIPGKIIFHRSNASSCLACIQSNGLHFNKKLPLNQDIEVQINTDQKGKFAYHCGMGRFHGKVIIK